MVNGKKEPSIRALGRWEIVQLFFMTLGVLSFLTSVAWSKFITGGARSWLEANPSVGFIFVGLACFIASSITFKQFKAQKLISAGNLTIVFILFFVIWILYSIIPEWMPSAFSVIFG